MKILNNFINKVICGDCIELMQKLPENSIDLIITSPPYNVDKKYSNYNDSRLLSDYHRWLRRASKEMYRVIRPNSNIFINICDVGISNRNAEERVGERGNFHVIPNHIVIIDEMVKNGAQYLHPIFWRKISNHTSQFGASARFCGTYPYPANCHVPSETEYILHFRKNGLYKKVDKKIREESKVSKKRWMQLSSQIWEFPGITKRKYHPAEFPIELPSRCIEGWSFIEDTVLDPFMGTGKTAVACIYLNRNYIGFEISPKYCEISKRSIDGVIPQINWEA